MFNVLEHCENPYNFIKTSKKLLKNKSKVLVTVNDHNLIRDYWIKTSEGNLIQVNIKEKEDYGLDQIFKKWLIVPIHLY